MVDFAPFMNIPYAEARCRDLAGRVLAAHGIEMPDTPQQARAEGWHPVEHPRPLDLVMFNTAEGKHVGVIVARGQFLHASKELGRSCVERLSAPEWTAQLEGFYRHG